MPVSQARAVAYDILLRVEQQDAYASELLHSSRLDQLSASDRNLATELVMGMLRWRSSLDGQIAGAAMRPLEKLDIEVLVALRLAAYQLRFLRVPAHAAINESVELVKRARKRSAVPFANAVLRKLMAAEAPQPIAGESAGRALAREYAHPEWLAHRWIEHFGVNHATAICQHDQRVPATAIRLESPQAAEELEREGIKLAPGALLASARVVISGDVTQSNAYRERRVFIQDEASQLVAALLGKGLRILDCCAAPGSKTAAIAARNPAAEVVAAEIHAHRADLLRHRVTAGNVSVIQADATALPLPGGFDRVLADVPCSGTGTLARNPEIKWRLQPDELEDLHAKQLAILRAAVLQLSPGGRSVYSTCSLEPEENEAVVAELLNSDSRYTLVDSRVELERLRDSGELAWPDLDSLVNGRFLRTLPGVHPCDGFFAAVIEAGPESTSG